MYNNFEVIIIRKFVSYLLIIVILLSSTVLAAPVFKVGEYILPVDVCINGQIIKCPQKAFISDGATFVPIRALTDALSLELYWDSSNNSAAISTIKIFADDGTITVNGQKEYNHKAILQNDTLFIPLRFVSEQFGLKVSWDDFYFIAEIDAPAVIVPEACIDYSYNKEDFLWLSRITHIESNSQPLNTQIGVANTVVNRKNSPKYPNTIKGAILDTNYGVQYPPAHTDKINVTPSYLSRVAAKCALNGINTVGNCMFFVPTSQTASSWVANNKTHFVTIGALAFYY